MKKLIMYNLNGEIHSENILEPNTIKNCIGMKTRCTMIDGSVRIGFADVYRTHDRSSYDGTIREYIFLWTYDNLNEFTHELQGDDNSKYNKTFVKVPISDIQTMESILFSRPGWGGMLTNEFQFHK